ncbi:toll/interleukin-1 receptor domain-containing protein [Dyella sp. RRB7]|uniref:toll/interleukin-1 receptor domain-containing protein n=1 Tax=Dyella sp. RRB7 TaxID=2919502 RepID=UPI001FA957D8|nr:toll/interleukin-1 receptor domain-containing protein [Dyella sp. RRB7]
MAQVSPGPALRYRAFISYSHQDKAWADWLHKALETYRLPSRLVGTRTAAGTVPRRLAPIFRDRDELASATDLGRKVNEALEQSANLIVICSPHSAASRWVNEEVRAFKRLGRSERVFCLVVDGEPNASGLPGREAEECFVPALRYRPGADHALSDQATEPIAADARPGKDGKTNAKLKLIAGMLDLAYDKLKQREQQRRQRRMAAITALAVLVTAITTTLAVMALRAQRIAEYERSQAEDLIGFMLGHLHTKLEAANRLDILDDVAGKAMDYFSALDESEVTDDSLAQRAKALQLIGRVREEQGKLDDATHAFNDASQLMKPLVARQPHNAAWQIALADSYSWLGMVAWDRGDMPSALGRFRLAAPLVEDVVQRHPENLDWFKHLGWLHNNLGHVLEADAQLPAARQEYKVVLGIYRTLVRREPTDRRYRSELGHAYGNLAGITYALGALTDAQDYASRALAIWQSLAQQDPTDMSVQMYLARATAMQGKVLQARGDAAAATAAFDAALGIGKHLLAVNPTSTESISDIASYSRSLAHQRRLDGDPSHAEQLLREATAYYTQLATREPDEPAWQTNLAATDIESAHLSWQAGDLAAATRGADAAQSLLVSVLKKHADYARALPLLAESRVLLGQLQAASGDLSAAAQSWGAALQALQSGTGSSLDPQPALLEPHAEALCLLGRTAEGEPVAATLAGLGDRDAQYLRTIAATPCHASPATAPSPTSTPSN